MAVVSVSLETDTTATNRELPARNRWYTNRARCRSCRPAASRRVRLPVLGPACAGASKSLQSASDAHEIKGSEPLISGDQGL